MAARRGRLGTVPYHVGLTILSLITITPLAWILFLTLKSRREFAANPFGLPQAVNLDNYIRILSDEDMLRFAANSVIVTISSLLLILVASILAGYALARIEFRGSKTLFSLFVLSDAIPIFVVIIPLFILIQRLGIGNTRWSVIFPYAAMHIGVATFVFRGFFRTISSEMEDAARIDGCNLLQMLWYVLVPLIRPAALVVALVNFISIWNEYYLAIIILPDQSLFTLPAGLSSVFRSRYAIDWPAMATGIVLSMLPVLLIFLTAQDKIVEGWRSQYK